VLNDDRGVRIFSLDEPVRGEQLGCAPIHSQCGTETDKERVVQIAVFGFHDKESVMSRRSRPELIDCGHVSRRTRGLPFLIAFEAVNPPFNRIFLIGP
jgi:hypothetical protein